MAIHYGYGFSELVRRVGSKCKMLTDFNNNKLNVVENKPNHLTITILFTVLNVNGIISN